MKHIITIDGCERTIDIRAMGEDFIVYRKMYKPPLTPENIGRIEPWDWREHLERFKAEGWQKVVEEFLRKQIRAMGSCAVLAWDGDGVIGKMYFATREMWDAFREAGAWMCIEHESMPKAILSFGDERLRELMASPSRTLRVLCFNVGHFDERYQGQGIAGAMLEYLKQWAPGHGWRRIEMLSCPDVVPFVAVGADRLRRGTLEKHGFRVVEEMPIEPDDAARRRDAVERIVSGRLWPADHWYVKSYGANIEKVARLARAGSWQDDCGRDYLMACDL